MALAQTIPDMDLNIFTTGPGIALELGKLSIPTIHMCGGTLNRFNQAVSGQSTLQMLEQINIATAFLGVSGYTEDGGFTCGKASDDEKSRKESYPNGQFQMRQNPALYLWQCGGCRLYYQ